MEVMVVKMGENKEIFLRCLENKLGFLEDNFNITIEIKDNCTTVYIFKKDNITGEWLVKDSGETLEEAINKAIESLCYDVDEITHLVIV